MEKNTDTPEPAGRLRLLDGTMLVMGSMIGSGIFIVSAQLGRDVGSPSLLLWAWILAGAITILGALNYGELAASMPKAGGQYVYLREAYGPLFGFLFGWTLFLVIQTGSIAAVGVGFAKFTGVFLPAASEQNILLEAGGLTLSAEQLVGIGVVVLLTLLNFRGVRTGAWIQNVFTITKVLALLAIVCVGLIWGGAGGASVSATFWISENSAPGGGLWDVGLFVFGAALVGPLFSADAWNNVTFTAGEMRNPRRSVPMSLLIGTGVVIGIYIICNIVYINVLGLDGIINADQDRVGTALMQKLVGPEGMFVMAALIMISTFGCLNGMIIAGARVFSAMAADGLFFPAAARLNRSRVPAVALGFQCVWACVLTLSGSYGDLLDYVIFAVMLFYIFTVAGVIVLRVRRPDMERPYKVFAYPVLPIVYVLLAAWVCVAIIIQKPQFAYPGMAIVLAGVPVYFLARRQWGNRS